MSKTVCQCSETGKRPITRSHHIQRNPEAAERCSKGHNHTKEKTKVTAKSTVSTPRKCDGGNLVTTKYESNT
jgi:hypothetical protein